jgi:two-component system, NtrC family, nitrogen regulation response regulator NtrX
MIMKEKKSFDILIVDDEMVICDFLKRFFQRDGQNPDVAQCGKQAFEKLNKKKYDLILCDLKMPKMNGLEFFSKMCNLHPEMADRIVFTSGGFTDDNNEYLIEGTGRPFVAKPMSLTTLQNLVLTYCPN